MKILFVISRFLDGGIDTVLVEYLKNLCKYTDYEVSLAIGMRMEGHEVFINRIPPQVKVHYLVENSKLLGYKVGKLENKKSFLYSIYDEMVLNPIRRNVKTKNLKRLAKDMDVVVDFDCCASSSMSALPKNILKITWFHFSIEKYIENSNTNKWRLYEKFSRYDKIVLIADGMIEEGNVMFPSLRRKFTRIYNALDLEVLKKRSLESINDERINEPYILAVERLEESQKDLTTLIKAYKKLSDEAADKSIPKLLILGEGASHERLANLISELNLDGRGVLMGFAQNPYPWMKNAQFIVHSAKFEGFGMALAEALLLGKFAISTDCPVGPREILNGGKSGILVPVGDVDSMAAAMRQVIENPDKMMPYLEDAKSHSRLFLPEESIKAFSSILDSKEKLVVYGQITRASLAEKLKNSAISFKNHTHKHAKFLYIIKGYLRYLTPRWLWRLMLPIYVREYEKLSEDEKKYVDDRVRYYCRLSEGTILPKEKAERVGAFIYGKSAKTYPTTYYMDSYESLRYFPANYLWHLEGGDVNYVCSVPSVTKSRPISTDASNANNTLLKLDKIRHFLFLKDPFTWEEKYGIALFRGACHGKPNREVFMQQYANHPLCDAKDSAKNSTNPPEWRQKHEMSIFDQLRYRYIMALEGNDVASNLKWVMSSNSVAVMPKPKMETWFMEGCLKAGYHYVEIADDYSDLPDKIQYYEKHPEEAKEIVCHAHEWCEQFANKKRESLIEVMTLRKYFSSLKIK